MFSWVNFREDGKKVENNSFVGLSEPNLVPWKGLHIFSSIDKNTPISDYRFSVTL